jgi:hypothetical protein
MVQQGIPRTGGAEAWHFLAFDSSAAQLPQRPIAFFTIAFSSNKNKFIR